MRRILAVLFGLMAGASAMGALLSPLDAAAYRFDLGPVARFEAAVTHEVALRLEPGTLRTGLGYPEFNRVFVVAPSPESRLVLPAVSAEGCSVIWRDGRGSLAGFVDTCDGASWGRLGDPRDPSVRPLPRIAARVEDGHLVIDTSKMEASVAAVSLRLPATATPDALAAAVETKVAPEDPEWRLVVAPAATGIPAATWRAASVLAALAAATISLGLYTSLVLEARARRRRDAMPVIMHGTISPDDPDWPREER